ncbi:adenine deaminase C-terminal domain-containing protein [Alkalihalobacillus sp. CinArs1]|uniref:adenine deaminase C-terminal domain-containing protein n=1 Tax=Alkalihalobacillus sp. CinArs1 TaxID=2995314 RepID=UPI0022DD23D2|nr:adenine deaminase C-terminal domain-containing protein [Alkalihalobacillus sp. CinArs1]
MPKRNYLWTKQQLRQQVQVVSGELPPSIVLTNATYLNNALKKWITSHIWIYKDRIVYVGDELPEKHSATEWIDCEGSYLVPGYIEPHAHPFQLYNPLSLARYASNRGTTTMINDNLFFLLGLPQKKALTMLDELDKFPVSMFWWARYDSQTQLLNEETITNKKVKEWLTHPLVIQGGELTAWPDVIAGDDEILEWMQETHRLGKPVEGHLPGASLKTLTKMGLYGVSCDHEAMTGEEALRRLEMGMMTSLRYSSIRPDLPVILESLIEKGVDCFDRVMMNTDGSTPSFLEQGFTDKLISIALEKGVPVEDAYAMVSYNVANHYGITDTHGMIAPGRLAHLNFLESKHNPTPVSVLARGEWIKKDGEEVYDEWSFDWEDHGLVLNEQNWGLEEDDLTFSGPAGIEMINAVITKPYNLSYETAVDELPTDHDESFMMLLSKEGKWRVNTVVKGFANKVKGFASSFSNSGDFILIGKKKSDMVAALERVRSIGGGIVLVEDGEVVVEIELPLMGKMSPLPLEDVIEQEKKMVTELKERGYPFGDPVYSLLFFSSTHLPFVRLTQQGIYDVKRKTVLFPAIMR